MPAVAIETVIIIIVVISFAVLAAVIFALYWLWHLLLEDRRCSRNFEREWQRQSSIGPLEDGPQRALLGSRVRNPRISRRREVFVDERSRRLVKASRCRECPEMNPTNRRQSTGTTTMFTANPVVPTRIEELRPPEVVVLDGTEPPPPYEETAR